MVTIGEKYVERAEKAVVETLVLHEVLSQPSLTLDTIVTRVRAVDGFTEKVDRAFIESAVKRLDRDGHLDSTNDRYTITDDGREDIQKIEPLFRNVASRLATTGATGTTATSGATGTLGRNP